MHSAGYGNWFGEVIYFEVGASRALSVRGVDLERFHGAIVVVDARFLLVRIEIRGEGFFQTGVGQQDEPSGGVGVRKCRRSRVISGHRRSAHWRQTWGDEAWKIYIQLRGLQYRDGASHSRLVVMRLKTKAPTTIIALFRSPIL